MSSPTGYKAYRFTAADDIRWREFYDAALNANLYPGTHMMADVKEFFAVFSNGIF